MNVLINVDEKVYKTIKDIHNNDKSAIGTHAYMLKAIANGIPISDNATNGEVFGKIMDYMFMDDAYITTDKHGYLHLRGIKDDWWNAPYER